MLDILYHNLPVAGKPHLLADLQKSGEVFPSTRCREHFSVHGGLHLVKILRLCGEERQDRRMDIRLFRVFLPDLKICLHINLFDAVQGRNIEFPHGFIVFRRVSCRHDDPAIRDLMISESLILQKLQHGRSQRLGNAVDLIDEEKSLGESCVLDLIVDRRNDLAHGIFRHMDILPAVSLLRDKRETDGTLSRMVRDRVGDETDSALPRHLLHDLGLSDSWRTDEQHRALPHGRDLVFPVCVLRQIHLYRIFNFLFCTLDVHIFLLRYNFYSP